MSLDDFDRCTPAEFRSIADSYAREEAQYMRSEWERSRMQCLCSLQPWSEEKLTARDIMRFPWDEEESKKEECDEEAIPKRTPEEEKAHWENEKRIRGLV
jgi:hypothetical protein